MNFTLLLNVWVEEEMMMKVEMEMEDEGGKCKIMIPIMFHDYHIVSSSLRNFYISFSLPLFLIIIISMILFILFHRWFA